MGIMNLIRQALFPYKFTADNRLPENHDKMRYSIASNKMEGIEGPYERL